MRCRFINISIYGSSRFSLPEEAVRWFAALATGRLMYRTEICLSRVCCGGHFQTLFWQACFLCGCLFTSVSLSDTWQHKKTPPCKVAFFVSLYYSLNVMTSTLEFSQKVSASVILSLVMELRVCPETNVYDPTGKLPIISAFLPERSITLVSRMSMIVIWLLSRLGLTANVLLPKPFFIRMPRSSSSLVGPTAT